MLIPWQQLNSDTLENLIASFVLREGSDYGEQEVSFAEKVAQVKVLLKQGRAVIAYSELHDTVTILPADHFTDHPST